MKSPVSPVPPLRLPLRSKWFLVASVVLFATTFAIGLLAKRYGSPGPDLSLDVTIIPERTAVLTGLCLAVNYMLSPAGNVVILLLICLVLMFALRRPLTALAFGSTVAVGWLSSEAGKIAVARLRPPTAATHALLLETGHSSFPSGHTAFAASLVWGAVLILATTARQRTITAIIGILFAVSVGLSRLYLGVHYPSDVFGSLLISTAGVMLWLPLWNHLAEPWLRRLPLTAILAAGPKARRNLQPLRPSLRLQDRTHDRD